MRKIKRYVPSVNPLPKIMYVRPTVTRKGTLRRGYFRRPKFRKGIVIGYRP